MIARRILPLALVLVLAVSAFVWTVQWTRKGGIAPSGGLYFPIRLVINGPHFLQGDPRWAEDELGSTPDTLASAGCAVSSAAMVLAGYGAHTDPGRLNTYLQQRGDGYTPQGWIYWERAAEADPALSAKILPHYEDAASSFLIDANLLSGNPVIVRIRLDSGMTHFVVICGKDGFDYLIRDPGTAGAKGVYALKDLGHPIEALRFYRKPH